MVFSTEVQTYIEGVIERVFSGRHVDSLIMKKVSDAVTHMQKGVASPEDLRILLSALHLASAATPTCCSKEEQTQHTKAILEIRRQLAQ